MISLLNFISMKNFYLFLLAVFMLSSCTNSKKSKESTMFIDNQTINKTIDEIAKNTSIHKALIELKRKVIEIAEN